MLRILSPFYPFIVCLSLGARLTFTAVTVCSFLCVLTLARPPRDERETVGS